MRIAKLTLAVAAIALAASTSPASADATFESGYNNGDIGSISLTVNSGLGSTTDDSPAEGVLDAKCDFHQVTTPSSNDILLVVVGHAVSGPRNGERAVATTIRCKLVRENGTVDVDEEMNNESMVGVWIPNAYPLKSTSWTVCASAKALYTTGSPVTTDALHCKAPSLLP